MPAPEKKKKRPGKNPQNNEWAGDQVTEGEVFWDTKGELIEIELGDPSVPYGLWKAIQEMRRNERSIVMIKPNYGYNHETYA